MSYTTSMSINGQFININKRIRIDLGFKVKAWLILPEKIIVVLDSDSYSPINENVKCYSFNGEEMWNIEAGNWPENYDCPVTGIWQKEGKLMVYRRCGFEQELDIKTGKELNCAFTK